MSGGGAGAAVPGAGAMGGAPWAMGAAPGGAMGGAAGGALGGLGAVGGAPAAVPAAGMDMTGGWQMPGITGGTKSLYAAPGATGAMAPPSPNWLERNPKARDAILKFGQSLLEQRTPGPGGPGGPGPGISRGQWQPPPQMPQMRPGLPQSSMLPGPDTGAYGGSIGGMGGGYGPFWGGR